MEYLNQLNEIVKYKTQAQHYMKLLADAKAVIQLAMDNYPDMKKHFGRIMKELDANKVASCFDAKGGVQ